MQPDTHTYPRLKLFLPLIYRIQEDHQVTPEEHGMVHAFMEEQTWLTEDEKKQLAPWTDVGHSTNNGSLNDLKNNIRQLITSRNIEPHGLISLGVSLLKEHEEADWVQVALANQDLLGTLNYEALYHFYPEWRSNLSQEGFTRASFDVQAMAAILDGPQAGLIKEIKSLIVSGTFISHHPYDTASYRQEVYQWCKQLADRGYGSLAYPDTGGGCEDLAAYFTVMETISYADLSLAIKYGVQFGLWGMSVLVLGTEKHHKKYLRDIGLLKIPGCFAMTETNHGSNVKGIETTALYNKIKRTFLINTPHHYAQKDYIGNAAVHGHMATVFAKLIIEGKDYGVSAFIVPLRSEAGNLVKGIQIEDCGHKMGLNGVDNGRIRFTDVEIPYDAMLDKFMSIDEHGNFQSSIGSENKRFFTILGTLVGGRIGVPRSALSATKTGLTTAILYADRRRQFGPDQKEEISILNYRMHQRRLVPLVAKTYALHFALQYMTHRFINRSEQEAQEVEAMAAGLKAYTTWHNTHALQECREACGGQGFLSKNRIDDLKNDSEIYTTFEGDNTVLMQLVAKSRLTEFKQAFNNSGVGGLISYVAGQALTSVTQKNPFAIRDTDEEHLLDREFHMHSFTYREKDLIGSAASRLKRLMEDGMDSFDAVNVCQHHMIQAGEAYIERIVVEQFYAFIDQVADLKSKLMLTQLCRLYALHTIEQNKAWYLEQDYMAPVKTKAIRKMVNQLCWDLRKDSVPLVRSFGVPENCLGQIAR